MSTAEGDSGSYIGAAKMVTTRQRPTAPGSVMLLLVLSCAMLSGCSFLPLPFFGKTKVSHEIPLMPQAPDIVIETPVPTDDASTLLMQPMPKPAARRRIARPRTRANPIAPPQTASSSMAPAELVGFEFASVLRVLRKPDSVQKNALSIVWVYSDSGCRLDLFFYPDIETAKFHLLKYELRKLEGEKAVDNSACMQQFMATRSDGLYTQ
jgi:hypothetical protein